jgi:hypothetical protein
LKSIEGITALRKPECTFTLIYGIRERRQLAEGLSAGRRKEGEFGWAVSVKVIMLGVTVIYQCYEEPAVLWNVERQSK